MGHIAQFDEIDRMALGKKMCLQTDRPANSRAKGVEKITVLFKNIIFHKLCKFTGTT